MSHGLEFSTIIEDGEIEFMIIKYVINILIF